VGRLFLITLVYLVNVVLVRFISLEWKVHIFFSVICGLFVFSQYILFFVKLPVYGVHKVVYF